MSCREPRFPAEDQIAYVASWSGVGAVCAYLVWIVAIYLKPGLSIDAGESMQIGAGLSGACALAWTLAAVVLH